MRLLKRVGDDKGGSLVELIIVIAIMAVLVAILAPQFIKYLGRAHSLHKKLFARQGGGR